MTKSVKFDENGRRSEIEIQIFSLNTQGAVQVGTWDTEYGIRHAPGGGESLPEGDSAAMSLRNRTFITLTALVSLNYIFKLQRNVKLKYKIIFRLHLMEC